MTGGRRGGGPPSPGVGLALRVEVAGALTTVQDLGRPGLAHLGVPRAGPLDVPAAALAHRLVGNRPDAALLEVTGGGLEVTLVGEGSGTWFAVTGAPVPVRVDGGARPAVAATARATGREAVRPGVSGARSTGRAEWLPVGARLRLGAPSAGVRSYLALAGGLDVTPVLGSRSTDTLAWVGPPRVTDGAVLPMGAPYAPPGSVDTPTGPVRTAPSAAPPRLRVHPGPRADRFAADALERLCAAPYRVTDAANRVGLRLDGTPLVRADEGELASEGIVLGAVQVPPDGQPVLFLADHPTTGGYPVLAVVDPDDLWQCAQLRPGEALRFALPGPGRVRSA